MLAIRETWAYVPATAYRASTGVQQTIDPADPEMAAIYRAGWERSAPGVGWRSPATMPLRLARLRYRVLDVRAERVSDAPRAESFGYPDWRPEGVICPAHSLPCMCAHEWRKRQWEIDHGPGSWERDWCFAATVERVES